MIEKEVRDILAEELTDKTTPEAFIATQIRIALKIFEKIAKLPIAASTQELVKEIISTKNRINTFLDIKPGSLLKMDIVVLKEVLSFYEVWLRVVTFLYDNYDYIKSQEFQHGWSKETILDAKNILSKKYDDLSHQLMTTQTLCVHHQDFSLINATLSWALIALLGYELFKQFMKEFNETTVFLRKYRDELLSPSA